MTASAGTPREEFLESVRRALGRRQSPPEPPYPRLLDSLAELETAASEVRERVAAQRLALAANLLDNAQRRGWQVYRSADPEEVVSYIGEVGRSKGVSGAVRSCQDALQELPLEGALEGQGITVTPAAWSEQQPRQELRRTTSEAGMGITGADYAVAETGSVVLVPRPGLGRLVSLSPPLHLAVVRPQDILESLDDLFLLRRLEYHRQGGRVEPYLNFITGPSRTADIEQTLVVGVHGPKEAHLVLWG